MNALLVRAAALVLCFMGVLLAIAAIPDANPARAFFGEDSCPMPCWQGIRPGVTLRTDAETILSTHPWLTLSPDVDIANVPYSGTYDLWFWTAEFPYPIPINRPDIAFTDGVIGYLERRTADIPARVGGMEMTTGLRLGDVWRMLGTPRSIASDGYIGIPGQRLHQLRLYAFDDLNIIVTAYQPCPITLKTLLESPVTLRLSPNPLPGYSAEPVMPTLYRLLRLRQGSVCGG